MILFKTYVFLFNYGRYNSLIIANKYKNLADQIDWRIIISLYQQHLYERDAKCTYNNILHIIILKICMYNNTAGVAVEYV